MNLFYGEVVIVDKRGVAVTKTIAEAIDGNLVDAIHNNRTYMISAVLEKKL